MIRNIIDQVVTAISPAGDDADPQAREAGIRLAAAVLMIDVARADHVFEESEFDRVLELVEKHFELAPAEAGELVVLATERAEELTSAHEFTRVLHEHLDENEKARIIGLLWTIAYADGRLDKYEDALIRKISDLLYVSRGLVMRLKHDAEIAAS